jgi:uncharacterized protein involved in type VI secretion and phage assembly
MADSPQTGADGVLRVTVQSGGAALSDTVRLVSLVVKRAVNGVPTARLVFVDGDMPAETFPVSDSDAFKPGAVIHISAGYGAEETCIFEGVVSKHGLQITSDNSVRLLVECCDKVVCMTLGRKNVNHVNKNDSDIIGTLIAAHGLAADVEATAVQHRALVQHGCSDWDFMLARAQANGLLVIATDGKVTVKAPDVVSAATLKVTYGDDLMAFEAELDTPTQGPKALQRNAGLARIHGRMRFQGSAKAAVGTVIELAGVGQRFSGTVFVSGVTHTISDGHWVTEAAFGLAPTWFTEQHDAAAPGASGLLPAVQGLQVGVVIRLEGDPAGAHRVQVKLPAMQAESDGVWARLLQFHGSTGFGAFFVPELGDEVVLGYFNSDPSQPVILGSVYSSTRAPAYGLDADNPVKAIVTRCLSKIEFNDLDKSIVVTTPGHNRIVWSDASKSIVVQDQHGNKLELNSSGISLDSAKDITLSAKGKISVDAVGAINITAKADVKTVGLNISCDAQVGFAAKGSASAELSASGQTVVKGAMVMIN